MLKLFLIFLGKLSGCGFSIFCLFTAAFPSPSNNSNNISSTLLKLFSIFLGKLSGCGCSIFGLFTAEFSFSSNDNKYFSLMKLFSTFIVKLSRLGGKFLCLSPAGFSFPPNGSKHILSSLLKIFLIFLSKLSNCKGKFLDLLLHLRLLTGIQLNTEGTLLGSSLLFVVLILKSESKKCKLHTLELTAGNQIYSFSTPSETAIIHFSRNFFSLGNK
ncbi:hypothetical protein C0J52_17052 [Blattella germanica]|nr:hypothetical protein C0J52_17052 [Blattella germanica]